jgi:hypothetical protein
MLPVSVQLDAAFLPALHATLARVAADMRNAVA